MKTYALVLLAATPLVLLTSCQTQTQTGALTGGVLGAGAGAIIGQSPQGALIGGAIGALAGGLIGHSLDKKQQETIKKQSPATLERINQGQPLAIEDIKALSDAKVSNEVIISQIRSTHTVFNLSTAQIISLTNAGVNQQVIDYMIQTGK
jgi:outer membrane lipoprotein SlyB